MPELPEVETIRRGLLPQLAGRAIVNVATGDRKIFQSPPEDLIGKLPGAKVRTVGRRGKYLIFDLGRLQLVIHLGMTGQLTLRNPEEPDSPGFLRHPATQLQRARQHPPDRHTHLQLQFDDGCTLCLRDPRKFGKVLLFDAAGGGLETFLAARLGLEPFSDEYLPAAFLLRLGSRSASIKSVLLDQHVVAGVGNIYADEALFAAGIHPLRRAHRLRRQEKLRLFDTIRRVLELGIQFGGTTLRDYIDSDGQSGGFQDELRVYGRPGEPCRRCGTPIVKIYVAQRGTHFCPICQPRSGRTRTPSDRA